MKINELVEGVEYVQDGGMCEDKRYYHNMIYRLHEGVLRCHDGTFVWCDSVLKYNVAVRMTFKPAPFEPEIGQNYYCPSFEYEGNYSISAWVDDKMDNARKRNVGVYRTGEEAQEAAQKLGWR